MFRRDLLAGVCLIASGQIAGCTSSTQRDSWVNVAGIIAVNETDRQRAFRLGISDNGTPIQNKERVEVPGQSRTAVEMTAEPPSDYVVAATVGEEKVVANTREFASSDAEWVVATVSLVSPTKLNISGTGYSEPPEHLFNSTETDTREPSS